MSQALALAGGHGAIAVNVMKAVSGHVDYVRQACASGAQIPIEFRPAREITLTLGPNKGQKKKIPAKKVLKFRVAKAAKDAVVGAKKKK